MLASSDASSNPFAELYAAISGRGESAATNVQVFFPHVRQPAGKAMNLNVRVDATVEEVTGFALWTYWKEGWMPKLDDGLSGDSDLKWATKLSAVGWIMRIAEEDGEVDDDFPRRSYAHVAEWTYEMNFTCSTRSTRENIEVQRGCLCSARGYSRAGYDI
jgi:hypothetical protein